MSKKSIVYWAPPNETFALFHGPKDMITNNLVKTRLIMEKLLDNINPGEKVAVKVHVGEAYNTHYLRHDYVREVVKTIKAKGGVPTLVETQGIGLKINTVQISDNYSIDLGHRKNASDHSKIAQLHGYTEELTGAPLVFVDGSEGLDGTPIKIEGHHYEVVEIGAKLLDFDKLVVISHFKGHGEAAFGGALKQLGQGSVTKKYKHLAHFNDVLRINPKKCNTSKCNQECISTCPAKAIQINSDTAEINPELCFGCFLCTKKCPVKRAIKEPLMNGVKEFVERVIDNATAVITALQPQNIRYINFAFDVTVMCDCISSSGTPIVPDLGIFGSSDPVAVDKACLDAEINAPGLPYMKNAQWIPPLPSGMEKFQEMLGGVVDSNYQFEAALKNGIGSTDYDLITL